ncbi:MAG: hypothetical protein HC880_19330 [Bacteroidia bacterium]|nr:hypothetical protein [Bacteroidia bacterium]
MIITRYVLIFLGFYSFFVIAIILIHLQVSAWKIPRRNRTILFCFLVLLLFPLASFVKRGLYEPFLIRYVTSTPEGQLISTRDSLHVIIPTATQRLDVDTTFLDLQKPIDPSYFFTDIRRMKNRVTLQIHQDSGEYVSPEDYRQLVSINRAQAIHLDTIVFSKDEFVTPGQYRFLQKLPELSGQAVPENDIEISGIRLQNEADRDFVLVPIVTDGESYKHLKEVFEQMQPRTSIRQKLTVYPVVDHLDNSFVIIPALIVGFLINTLLGYFFWYGVLLDEEGEPMVPRILRQLASALIYILCVGIAICDYFS